MKEFKDILLYINTQNNNNNFFISQRKVAEHLGLSLGKTNTLIAQMIDVGLITSTRVNKNQHYALTPSGQRFLERELNEEKGVKISYINTSDQVKSAVILAAGVNKRFDQAVGTLLLDEMSIIERTILILQQNKIEQIVIVTGHRREEYRDIIEKYQLVEIQSAVFEYCGSMSSLALVKDVVKTNFLLIEIDYIFEAQLLKFLLEDKNDTALVVASLREHGNERYVEYSDEFYLERIASDVRQLNKIHGDLTGISKISLPFFHQMLELYEKSENVLVNYEYIIERIANTYNVYCMKLDDLICIDADDEAQFHTIKAHLFPLIKKREKSYQEQELKAIFARISGIDKEVVSIRNAGGMSNTNYIIEISEHEKYVLRLSSETSSKLINRVGEKMNMDAIQPLHINVATLYFDEHTGMKLAKYIDYASTLSSSEAKMYHFMKKTSQILKTLHQAEVNFHQIFNPFQEIEKYVHYMEEHQLQMSESLALLLKQVTFYEQELHALGYEMKPCHNDLVPENFIYDQEGRFYLIDWEYSNMNDPMWDLAAHFIECNFSEAEEDLYLHLYFNQEIPKASKQKILLFKILQDTLWSAWTIVKEANGIDFGDYGMERTRRGYQNNQYYMKHYKGV